MWLRFFWEYVDVNRFRVIVHHSWKHFRWFQIQPYLTSSSAHFPWTPHVCLFLWTPLVPFRDFMRYWSFCELISASLWALLLASTKRWCFQNKLFRAVIGIQSRKGVEDAHSGQRDQHVEGGSAPYSGDYPILVHIFYLLLFMGLTSCVSAPLGADCSLTCRHLCIIM